MTLLSLSRFIAAGCLRSCFVADVSPIRIGVNVVVVDVLLEFDAF